MVSNRLTSSRAPLPSDAPADQSLEHRRIGVHAACHVANGDADAPRPGRMAGDRRRDRSRPARADHRPSCRRSCCRFRSREMSTVISLGCRARSVALSKPARSAAPGARFWMKTSALATSRCSSAESSAFLMSSDEAFLAAIEPDEIARRAMHGGVVAAREIAFRPLDLDDPRAGIGQTRRAIRRGNRLLQGDHQQAVQRLAGLRPRRGSRLRHQAALCLMAMVFSVPKPCSAAKPFSRPWPERFTPPKGSSTPPPAP